MRFSLLVLLAVSVGCATGPRPLPRTETFDTGGGSGISLSGRVRDAVAMEALGQVVGRSCVNGQNCIVNSLTVRGSQTIAGALTVTGLTITNGLRLSSPTTAGVQFGGSGVFFQNGSGGPTVVRSLEGDSAASTGVQTDTLVAYTTPGAKLLSVRNGGTEKFGIDRTGFPLNASSIGTAASGTGITANYSGAIKDWVHKVTVINTALAAAGTSDVTLAVTPVNSRIVRVTADVTQVFTGGALSAMTVMCGNTAGGNQYLLANSVFTAQNTWGDVAAEVGAGLLTATWADFGTSAAGVPGAITVQCRFTCTGANCSAATQGSVTFYVEGVTY